MALPRRLIIKLACPSCHAALTYEAGDKKLQCGSCDLSYRVEEDIPILQVDEAVKTSKVG
jgi:LSD1 subclass zinc finger protein